MPAGTVIVGTGQGGFQVAASLRTEGYQEPIVLVGDEPLIPYQRPPLSKGYLLGKQDLESIELRPASFYKEHEIDLLAGQRATAIDRANRRVKLESGALIPYTKLVLATGARNRLLPIPGAQLDGVLYLRTLGEAVAIKERIEHAQRIVVIGGGFIGLELAAVASMLGKSVVILEALPRLMSRVVAPIVSDFFQDLHAGKGIEVLCCSVASEIVGSEGRVREVKLKDGAVFPADLVLVGIGVLPNDELARDAGLAIGNGIVVDENLQMEDKDVFAIGDCADHPNPFAGARIRLESVQNAADQAQCVARAIAGKGGCYNEVPWFWTDQFDIKLQMVGISTCHDRIVTRGNLESRKLSVFYFQQGRLIAIDSINRPIDHIIGRKLIAGRVPITPEQAADESVDLKKLAQAAPLHGN